MKFKLIIAVLFAVLVSCSGQRQLRKAYIGRPANVLEASFGEPAAVFEEEEGQLFIYEKTENLRSTEIQQGKLTLDPIVTPKVTKTERYYFTVKDGMIVKARFEEEYER